MGVGVKEKTDMGCKGCIDWVGGARSASCPLSSVVPGNWAAGCSERREGGQVATATPPKAPSPRGVPNKTEAAYRARHLVGKDARYEALTFRMANGHRYTPDWVVMDGGRPVECHEVKGSYRLGSYQRARLAFDQARVEYPGIVWVWGEG